MLGDTSQTSQKGRCQRKEDYGKGFLNPAVVSRSSRARVEVSSGLDDHDHRIHRARLHHRALREAGRC
jgi:hypothetical protein